MYVTKGSRLVFILNVNKNPYDVIDYGTVRNVSEESVQDAKVPLNVKWYFGSYIEVPVCKH